MPEKNLKRLFFIYVFTNTMKNYCWLMAAAALCGTAQAQSYPSKPVRLIVGFAPGGGTDVIARVISRKLADTWPASLVIENRPGADGSIATELVAKAPADGYTLFQCNIASSAIATSLYAKMPYDHQRDFAPITRIGLTPNVVVVHPSLPARSMQEFIAYARTNPGKLSYGTSAAGTSSQLTMELLKLTAKIDVVHVAYKGAPQALSDTVGGQIPASVQTAPAVMPTILSGRVRALGVTCLKRIAQLPEVPTLHETALPGFEANSWYGLCAPTATPAPVLDKINADLTTVLRSPEIQRRFVDLVILAAPTSRDEFTRFIAAETTRWARVIKGSGIGLQ